MVQGTYHPVTVVPVRGRRAIRSFLHLPHRLYAGDPHWIAPLEMEQKQRIFGNNPFFEHAEVRAWLAVRDGETVGRITAQIDRLHEQQHGERIGYFGMLEAEDDTAVYQALLNRAEDWLRKRAVQRVRGPFNLSINEETGLLVDGFDSPPFVMMGHARPGVAQALEDAGYAKARDLYTYTLNPDFETPAVMRKLVERQGQRIRVRRLDRRRATEEFELLRDIFNDAWSGNWGFVPFTQPEFADMAKSLSLLVPDDYIRIAEVDGYPVAFIVVLPNLNEAIRDLGGRLLPMGWARLLWRLKVRSPGSARVPLMGVRRAYQRTRQGSALAFMVIDAVRKAVARRGVKTVEMGWILEDNDGMRSIIETIGGRHYKTYRVYEKELAALHSGEQRD